MTVKKLGTIVFIVGVAFLILSIVLMITTEGIWWLITLGLSIVLNVAALNLLFNKAKNENNHDKK